MKPPYQPPHRNGIYPEHTPESLLPLLNEVDKLHERFIRYKRRVPEHLDLWRVRGKSYALCGPTTVMRLKAQH